MDISIRHALHTETGEVLDAHIVLGDVESGQRFRHLFHLNDPELLCVECGQGLHVSTHPFGGVFFKHYPGSGPCILKDGKLSEDDRRKIEQYYVHREGKRHKHLKKEIGMYLTTHAGVAQDTITIDDKFISDGSEKRRPDICFEFEGRKIVFEIQISRLPGRYISQRHEFYKRMGMYLIWILDDFNKDGQDQTSKDIKYLSYHQNYFYFNDSAIKPTLVVQFKKGFLHQSKEPRYIWQHEFVTLAELKYDSIEYQAYFISLRDEERKLNDELLVKDLNKALGIFRKLWESDNSAYYSKCDDIFDELDFNQFEAFNRKIGGVDDSNLFFRAVAESKQYFLIYILKTPRFVNNMSTKNKAGRNLLEEVLRKSLFAWRRIVQLMFETDYIISESDRLFLNTALLSGESKQDREKRVVMIYAYNHLRKPYLINVYDRIEGAVLVILSARYGKIIGQGFSNFLEVANNAVQHYRCWRFIESAMKYYGLLEKVEAADKKETFANKRSAYIEPPSEVEELLVLAKLFPEVTGGVNAGWIDGDLFNAELTLAP